MTVGLAKNPLKLSLLSYTLTSELAVQWYSVDSHMTVNGVWGC